MSTPTLSVIVPFQRSRLQWGRCLEALCRQSHEQAEVIAVDADGRGSPGPDGPTPPSGTVLRSDGPLNAAQARNMGAAHAKGDILLFVDGDVVCDQDVFAEHVAFHGDHGRGVLLGYVNAQEGVPFDLERRHSGVFCDNSDLETMFRAIEADPTVSDVREHFIQSTGCVSAAMGLPWTLCWTTCVSVPRTSCVPFDEDFECKGSEDLEWGRRLHECGHKFWLGARCRTFHYPHGRDRMTEIDTDLRNVHRFLRKHPSPETECLAAFDCLHADRLHRAVDALWKRISFCDEERHDVAHVLDSPEWEGKRVLILGSRGGHRWPSQVEVETCHPGAPRSNVYGRVHHALMGCALPFAAKQFDCAIIGGALCGLPEWLLCRVLQECLVVAARVYVYVPRRRVAALEPEALSDATKPYWAKRYYFSTELEDFSFHRKAECLFGALWHARWAAGSAGLRQRLFPRG